jgi:SET domain-containing protein
LFDRIVSSESIEKYNTTRTDSLVEIRRDDDDGKGWGLFAKECIRKGRVVFRGSAVEIRHDDDDHDKFRDSHTVQTDWNTHVLMDLPAVLVNHSCEANVGIQPNDVQAYDFIALRDIQRGEEIVWDYETSEYDIASQFACSCGSTNCRGVLSGYKDHGPVVKDLYGEQYIAPYLMQQRRRL